MLELRRLRLLLELERRGTMAAVAKVVGASPSAVSQQLGLLEEETGAKLLEPVGRGVRLTDRARALVEHARVILERLERAESELASWEDEPAGTLKVAVFQSVLSTIIPPALSRLAEQYPRLRVEISQRGPFDALEGLLSHDHDLVIGEELPGFPQAKDAEIDEEDLAIDEIRLALPRKGRWAGLPAKLGAAAEAPWVMDPKGTTPALWARTMCREAGFEPDVRFDSPDPTLHLRLVEEGQAVAFLPDLLQRLGRRRVRLVRLPGRPARRLFTAARRGSAQHPAIVALRASLGQEARSPASARGRGSAREGASLHGAE